MSCVNESLCRIGTSQDANLRCLLWRRCAARKIGTGQIRFFATVDKHKMKGLEALENCLLAKRGGGSISPWMETEKKMKMNVSEIALALLLPKFHTNAERAAACV